MTSRFSSRVAILALVAAAALAACGGGGPSSPDAQGVTLRGTLVGATGSLGVTASSTGARKATAEVITVTVLEDPSIKTTVGTDGSFTLRGLPPGTFTLVFTSSAGVELGRITFSGVLPNQELTITVASDGSTITLLEEQRNGIGHGDVEIEGDVSQVLPAVQAGELGRLLVNGKTVAVTPGQTAIREGNRSRNFEDVTVGRHVHVKGTWLPMEGTLQPVLAQEIMLQGDTTTTPNQPKTDCAAGDKAEVEGPITGKGGSSITVHQNGHGDYEAEVSGGTRIRKGNTTYTFAQLQTGWRVHVSGSNLGLSGTTCRVDADEIKVQQN